VMAGELKAEYKIPIGSTLTRVAPDQLSQNTWCRLAGSSFRVRCGPNYKKNKMKAPSEAAFCKAVGLDLFKTEKKVNHICRFLRFPDTPDDKEEDPSEVAEWKDDTLKVFSDPPSPDVLSPTGSTAAASDSGDMKSGKIPTWVVINFQIPSYEPNNPIWGATKDDGEGYSLVFYFCLKESARKAMELPDCGGSSSLQLLRNFFNAPLNGFDEFRKRLKAIPRLVNPEDADLNFATRSLVNNYNAKPFMTGPRCHSFYQQDNYLEVDVDVHRFCWPARKGAYSLMDQVDRMVIDMGFVVEAVADEEMPEQMLACLRISRVEVSAAKTLEQWLERAKKNAENSGNQ